ncbi:Ethanolamine kinase [Nakaseomyces bracarensis]|uniref:Ethanolamine kinase n=1 Tax=Nakaseomyces bracarensis TaxID=273131 RepID=A0ABR4NRT1_9SACH
MPLNSIEPHSPSSKKNQYRRPRRHSSIGSSGRKPSLTRNRSAQRLIRTISIESIEKDYYSAEDEDTISSGNAQDTDKDGVLELDSATANLSLASSASHAGSNKSAPSSSNTGVLNVNHNESIAVPFVKASLDITLPQDYFKNDVANMIQSLKIPRWYARGMIESPLKRESLKLTKIAGAMTNAIFKVEYPHLPSLLLRVYGSNNDMIIDREYELQVLARLSIQHIGPSLYGCFLNGRFEQFLENATTLTKDDIRDWKTSQRIARRMKELHSGVPLIKSEREGGSMAWNKIDQWINEIEENGIEWISNDDNVAQAFGAPNWESLKNSIDKYRKWLFSHGDTSFVFCHNDAQYGNLLFSAPVMQPEEQKSKNEELGISNSNTSTSSLFPSDSKVSLADIINPTKQEQSQDSKLVVIDFEYAGANVAAYDLANHFSEWMYNYSSNEPHKCYADQYPNKEQMLNFVYSYVSHLRGSSKTSIDDEVRTVYNEIVRWRGTVQIFWSLWALIQSGKIQFKSEAPNEDDGIAGEKYIIKSEEAISDEHNEEYDTNDVIAPPEGVSIDTFDYMGYCSDKISVFWGDALSFEVIDASVCDSNKIKQLDSTLL